MVLSLIENKFNGSFFSDLKKEHPTGYQASKVTTVAVVVISSFALTGTGVFGVICLVGVNTALSTLTAEWITYTCLAMGGAGLTLFGAFVTVCLLNVCLSAKDESENQTEEVKAPPKPKKAKPKSNTKHVAKTKKKKKKVIKETSHLLVPFYLDAKDGKNNENVSLERMWQYFENPSKSKGLNTHHLIQWLFPSKKGSVGGYNRGAPKLNQTHIDAFTTGEDSEMLQKNVTRSFMAMMTYYFLEYDEGVVSKGTDFDKKAKGRFLKKGDHNFRRITRMFEFLHAIGRDVEATAFFIFLEELSKTPQGKCISATNLKYWKKAAGV